jgi:hypothetical protein
MPALTAPQPLTVSAADLASLTSPANAAAFTPHLAAQLLNVTPLLSQGVNGAGQTMAIVSRSNINSADVAAFRSAFGLPASPLQISVNGPDPGLADDQAEATLAASWAGAAAPGAQILLAPAATTAATDGVDLSLADLVDNDLANVIAVGYSACEAALSPAHQAFYSALYQQAAAEGITVIAATGDSGAAACTQPGGTAPVDTGFAVNALASTPWNTAVGVAAYGAGGAAAGTSALTAWSPADPDNPAYAPADPAYASGGGSSTLYSRKIWQPIPSELATASAAATHSRFLPDLALPTALDSSVNLGLAFCLSDSAAPSGCTLVRSGGSGVATAFFAGVAALINQKNGVQGNLGPSLYATSRAFNDVAQGTSKLACVPGSSGCDATGLIGYAAGSGYDLATGLGVPDVEKLVTELAKPLVTGATPTITLSITPVQANHTYNPSALVTFTVRVVDPTAAGIPTGTANLYDTTNYDVLTPNFALTSSGSATTGSSVAIGPLELSSLYNYSGPETYNLGAHSSGDSTYPGGDSGYLLTVTAALSPTVLTITPSSNSPALGTNITVTVTLGIAASGPPAGSVPPSGAVTLTVNGVALNPVSLSTTGSVTSAVFTVPITATSNSIVASYPGDSNYGSSTSNLLLIPIQGFTLTASPTNPPTNLNLTKGGAGSESFVITGVGGYTGLVQVICTVPTQDDMTCAVSPQQVTPTATVTFVVQTYITGGPLYAAAGKPRLPGRLWPQAAGGAMLAGVLFFLLPFGRRARVFLHPLLRQVPRRFIVLLMLLAALAGTGIGCSSPSTTVTDIGTPLGVATLQVTATAYVDNAVVAQTLNFTVNVQPQ